MKKLLLASAFVASFGTFADPILLPDGLSIPSPQQVVSAGDGNLDNPLGFVQYFSDASGNVVNIGNPDFFAGDTTQSPVIDVTGLHLNGYGLIRTTPGSTGDLSCNSCSLVFEFGGLEAITDNNGIVSFNSDGSFMNVFVSADKGSSFAFSDFGSASLNSTFADDFIDEENDALWLSGSFSETFFSGNVINGNLVAGLELGFVNGTLSNGVFANTAVGVAEGNANGNVVKNAVTDPALNDNPFFYTDFFDVVAFSLAASFGTQGGINTVASSNSGDIKANVVSTPATLGLFGLALMGMGLVRRNKKA
ncbi:MULTISPECIES: PEP-CTERM sorting domain-containing protein [unclassified Alteromonas]|uniref:PEP-CTERM sorting domain-containing protein n=1 Tax=unclassified Alteromonas TaxID=2614992 RepID=UPI0005098EEE|nr:MULTISPECIES: PEP-CTERM sorting domain-containing protein [unclassified Alteromonas]